MTKRKRNTILLLIILLLAAASMYYVFVRKHRFDSVVTTSKSPTAQSDYSDGDDRKSNSSNDIPQGGAVDTGGTNVPIQLPGITSESGIITVKQPAKSEKLGSGSSISGTAKDLTQVQYRLIDDEVGVIARGSLSVVKGAFSGTLQFKSYATTGRLDVFSTNLSGDEINTVEIPVGFKE